jgi:hypothetical protein
MVARISLTEIKIVSSSIIFYMYIHPICHEQLETIQNMISESMQWHWLENQ